MNVPTPLHDLPTLARALNVARIWAKDESRRPLGNFKSLGGTQAALSALDRAAPRKPMLICASDGNHGLAVAAAAQSRGAEARIYLPTAVGGERMARIAKRGATIVRVDGSYDAAVTMAWQAAMAGEGVLIPDTSDDPDDPVVAEVMGGYARIPDEIGGQLGDDWPTHIFVQAGVGGLAAAVAEGMLTRRGAKFVVVEPANAACVGQALAAGRPVQFDGDLDTCADMLSCGLASAGAVATLLRFDCAALAIDEPDLRAAPAHLVAHGGPSTTPTGAAGLAGLTAAMRPPIGAGLGLDPNARVLLFVTEGPCPAPH